MRTKRCEYDREYYAVTSTRVMCDDCNGAYFGQPNVGVLQQRSHEIARAVRIPPRADCSNASLAGPTVDREALVG